MATRFLQKFASTSSLLNRPTAGGIGIVNGRVFANIDGNIQGVSEDLPGVTYHVDPQNGSDNNDGLSWGEAFASFSALDSILDHGDTIYLRGVIKQQWSAPIKNDITIIGAANQPRQATDSGVANGGGATWLNTGTVASPLIDLANNETDVPTQGWRFVNIFFNNAGAAACVKLGRTAGGGDSSHASFYGCKFTGALYGVQAEETSFVTIKGCTFFDFTDSGDTGIKGLTVGVGNPPYRDWVIEDNVFSNNDSHIVAGLYQARIIHNTFTYVGASITTSVQVNLTGGAANIVQDNYFQVAHDQAGSDAMFLPQSTANSWLNWYRGGLTALVPATAP